MLVALELLSNPASGLRSVGAGVMVGVGAGVKRCDKDKIVAGNFVKSTKYAFYAFGFSALLWELVSVPASWPA